MLKPKLSNVEIEKLLEICRGYEQKINEAYRFHEDHFVWVDDLHVKHPSPWLRRVATYLTRMKKWDEDTSFCRYARELVEQNK